MILWFRNGFLVDPCGILEVFWSFFVFLEGYLGFILGSLVDHCGIIWDSVGFAHR